MKSQAVMQGSADGNPLELKPEWIVKSGNTMNDGKKVMTLNETPSVRKNLKK